MSTGNNDVSEGCLN